MDTGKIGKLISELRKERNLTQRELADILGVSPKTISKWETGSGLPDISIIQKIAEEFEISLEELLEGTKKENNMIDNRVNKKRIFIIIGITLMVIVMIALGIFKIYDNGDRESDDTLNLDSGKNNCTAVRIYNIDNVANSNDENYIYITVSEFQEEGVFTVKLSKALADKIEEGKTYEFTFKTSEENSKVTTDKLFENSEIINIAYSDKVGLERVRQFYCY